VIGATSRARKRRGHRTPVTVALPSSLVDRAGWDPGESAAELGRRRRIVAGVSVVGAALLGASLSTRPGSPQFYGLTLGVAAIWTAGGLGSGPLRLGDMRAHNDTLRRPVIMPVLIGVGTFVVFYGCALVARRIPMLKRAIFSVLRYAHRGSDPLVLITTLANGAAEEVFFRGALYSALDGQYPIALSTAVYSLATTATRNPALVLASVVMGALFGLQRRTTGGIQAPMLTHLVWSLLMVRFLPPLFHEDRGTTSSGSPRGPQTPRRPNGRTRTDIGWRTAGRVPPCGRSWGFSEPSDLVVA
jgi:membrane protease YdiL (CAAX protease family)